MHRLAIVLGLMLTILCSGFGQVNKSNIYMFNLQRPADTVFQFSNPTYLTLFNKDGYNNHPWFFNENTLYISSQTISESQPELMKLDLTAKTRAKVTATVEGEYSPMPVPDVFGGSFSAVRMEFQGQDTLIRLWQFPEDRTTNGRPVFKYNTNVGYYCWLNSQQVATFLVGEPSQLAIGDIATDQFSLIDENVGRCLRVAPNGNLMYVLKKPFGLWQIIEYNIYNQKKQVVGSTLPNIEDFAVLRDGTLLMGSGSKIFKLNPIRDTDWVEVADLRFYDINGITRIAVSWSGKVAIVAN